MVGPGYLRRGASVWKLQDFLERSGAAHLHANPGPPLLRRSPAARSILNSPASGTVMPMEPSSHGTQVTIQAELDHANRSNHAQRSCPLPASMPIAMGRWNALPSLRTSAGAMVTKEKQDGHRALSTLMSVPPRLMALSADASDASDHPSAAHGASKPWA